MDDQVYCYDLECNEAFLASRAMHWPMFRNGRLRTGCYVEPSITGVEEPDEFVPDVTGLHTIYPNPFNPVTRIVYDVARMSHVNITVYDVLGNRVYVLKDAIVRPGRYEISWTGTTDSGTSVASGVYFCRLAVDGVVQTKKMVLLRQQDNPVHSIFSI